MHARSTLFHERRKSNGKTNLKEKETIKLTGPPCVPFSLFLSLFHSHAELPPPPPTLQQPD